MLIAQRRRLKYWFLLFLIIIFDMTCGIKCSATTTVTSATIPTQSKKGKDFSGNVSWYGPGFNGKKTTSGETFDMNKPTAAHLTLPFGTRVLVEDPKTGKSTVVKVNDRGPYVHTRVMDLSKEGARKIDLLSRGKAYVNCLIIN